MKIIFIVLAILGIVVGLTLLPMIVSPTVSVVADTSRYEWIELPLLPTRDRCFELTIAREDKNYQLINKPIWCTKEFTRMIEP